MAWGGYGAGAGPSHNKNCAIQHRICGTGAYACGYATRWHNDGTFEILGAPAARLLAKRRPSGALTWAICRRLDTISFGAPGIRPVTSVTVNDAERIEHFAIMSGLAPQSVNVIRPDLPRWVRYMKGNGVTEIPDSPLAGQPHAVNMASLLALTMTSFGSTSCVWLMSGCVCSSEAAKALFSQIKPHGRLC